MWKILHIWLNIGVVVLVIGMSSTMGWAKMASGTDANMRLIRASADSIPDVPKMTLTTPEWLGGSEMAMQMGGVCCVCDLPNSCKAVFLQEIGQDLDFVEGSRQYYSLYSPLPDEPPRT